MRISDWSSDVCSSDLELADAGARPVVEQAHAAFGPLNARLLQACTDWQLRPENGDRMTPNTHTDKEWDATVLAELETLDAELAPVVTALTSAQIGRASCRERGGQYG